MWPGDACLVSFLPICRLAVLAWKRVPRRMSGHARTQEVGARHRLMPPPYVKAYVKRGKNDAADAAVICESRHPTIDAICADQGRRRTY